jgi:hypothetical protein
MRRRYRHVSARWPGRRRAPRPRRHQRRRSAGDSSATVASFRQPSPARQRRARLPAPRTAPARSSSAVGTPRRGRAQRAGRSAQARRDPSAGVRRGREATRPATGRHAIVRAWSGRRAPGRRDPRRRSLPLDGRRVRRSVLPRRPARPYACPSAPVAPSHLAIRGLPVPAAPSALRRPRPWRAGRLRRRSRPAYRSPNRRARRALL